MINLELYKKAFRESLSLDEKKLKENLKYNDIPEWDSIGHMTLMSSLEEAFKINIETDDKYFCISAACIWLMRIFYLWIGYEKCIKVFVF